ncbi:MAG: cobalamin-dependent protein, partial [Bacillota bacterium]|nr:cobalamin-dependent protein [Bacillota bacterium]
VLCEEYINEYIPKLNLTKKSSPKIGIAVLLDNHSLGKSIVSSIVSACGYELKDLGTGLTPKSLVDLAKKHKIDVILISTLMLPSAMKVREVYRMIKDENLNIKIIVGGAPFRLDDQLWKMVGADARGKTASDVITLIEEVM